MARPAKVRARFGAAMGEAAGDKKARQPRITLRELRGLLEVEFAPLECPRAAARCGELVSVADRSGYECLSGKAGALLARPDLLAGERKPTAPRIDQVVAIHHRTGQGDYVIVESLATPRLGRVEGVLAGPEYLVRTLLEGRRWAEARMRFRAVDIWPLPGDPTDALLAKMDLPFPPGIPKAPHCPVARPNPMAVATPPGSGVRHGAIRQREPEGPPMPPGELAGLFAKVAYPGKLRRYQSMALDAFEKARASGRRRAYLVLPPGAGKTLIGLEIARRLGNRCLVLGPNTAIQEQWVKQWRTYQPASVGAGDTTDLTAPITALTYQAICDLDSHNPLLEQQVAEWQAAVQREHPAAADANPHHRTEAARLRSHAPLLLARSAGHEQLLSILHPNGRNLIELIRAAGQFTIVLDECHHLLEMWGYLLRALALELGTNVFLVGLTATPPSEMGAREAVLYQELFAPAAFAVPTPPSLKEGHLPPYHDPPYLTAPLPHQIVDN